MQPYTFPAETPILMWPGEPFLPVPPPRHPWLPRSFYARRSRSQRRKHLRRMRR